MFEALYVHIPFCRSRCRYCDFFSYGPQELALQNIYADLICQEINLWQGKGSLATLYLGGGTPTVLPAEKLCLIFQAARKYLALSPKAEITVEANPATVDATYLKTLRQGGCNRLSLGVQSFQKSELENMGRLHGPNDVVTTIAAARQAGFENISLDLIYGLPGQTLETWADTLDKSIALATPHISLYSLTLDNHSPWGKAYAVGALSIPDEDLVADMLELAIAKLSAAGILQYEIANFSRPGYESRHNSSYWQRKNYLGVGLAAASCWKNYRWQNTTDAVAWQKALLAGEKPPAEKETLSFADVVAEKIFLGLRLLNGIDIAACSTELNCDIRLIYREVWQDLVQKGLLQETSSGYALTKRGIFLGNQVFAAFLPEK